MVSLHAYQKIINYLASNKGTYREIAKATGLSYDGIRGRISELRTWYGIPIESCGGDKKNPILFLRDKNGIIQRIPFQFQVIEYPGGRTIAVSIPMEFANETPDTEPLLAEFKNIIEKCKKLIAEIEKNRKTKNKQKDTLLNWEIGDVLFNFQNKFIEGGFYCFNYDEILEKFIGTPGKGGEYRREYWRVRREFKRNFPDKNKLLPLGFNIYNEINRGETRSIKKLEKWVYEKYQNTGSIPSIDEIRKKRWEFGGTQKGSSKKHGN